MKNKWLAWAVSLLFLALVVLLFVSWFLSATMTAGVRPLLSEEGIRWFCGTYSTMLASPLLVYLMIGAMAWGCFHRSGLCGLHGLYRRRLALRLSVVMAVVYLLCVLLLVVMPGGVLLSATGHLWPSPFSRALIPFTALGVILVSVVYGWVSGRFVSFSDLVGSLCHGISDCAPLFVVYVLTMQLYESMCYVFQ